MTAHGIELDSEAVREFCRKWKIVRFELFGSALRDDFDENSDVDVLVTFAKEARWKFHDELVMERELAAMFRRPADLIERRIIEQSPNWVRRRNILGTAQAVYAA